jgi:hypothetical protein
LKAGRGFYKKAIKFHHLDAVLQAARRLRTETVTILVTIP